MERNLTQRQSPDIDLIIETGVWPQDDILLGINAHSDEIGFVYI